MIQTEVKAVGDNEHTVRVQLPQAEYDRIYAEQIQKLSGQAKLPGFRPGKTPTQVIEQQFGAKLHEDTVSELVQTHYIEALESSGLKPATQPELDVPAVQPSTGFEFMLKVVTWPSIKVKKLDKLKFDETTVTVEKSDIRSVIDRLQKSQVKFEIEDKRAAKTGDQLHIDFAGFIDNEPFEGGKGEDVPLVLGEGRFIPGFEDALIGKKAGDDCTIEVTFPEDYQATHLAGQAARFEARVKSVGKPVKAKDDDELATMLGFDDAAALQTDVQQRLEQEAEDAGLSSTREAAFDALLAANAVTLPETLIEQDMRASTMRVAQNMKQQGLEPGEEMFKDEAFQQEVRSRSEKGLKLSVLLQSVRDQAEIDVDDAEVDTELEQMAEQYPEEQRDQFKTWFRRQKEQMGSVRERLLERKCVAYIVSQAKTKQVSKSLSAWQDEQDAAKESA
ncbi:MAG: trigger factor [Mariprofundaceae bacterium]